jgi:hypothetical protein
MENYDTYRFVHSIHQRLHHRVHQIAKRDDEGEVLRGILVGKLPEVMGTREHLLVSLAIMDAFLPWRAHGEILHSNILLHEQYLGWIRHLVPLLFRLDANVLDHLSPYSPVRTQSKVSAKTGKKHTLTPKATSQLIFQSWTGGVLLHIENQDEFHLVLHRVALLSYTLIDMYQRYGSDGMMEFIHACVSFLGKLGTIHIKDTDLAHHAKHPYDSFKELLLAMQNKHGKDKTKPKVHHEHISPEEAWMEVATLAVLFQSYKGVDRDAVGKSHPIYYNYRNVYRSTIQAIEDGTDHHLMYDEQVYPFYYDTEAKRLYYVPFIPVSPDHFHHLLVPYLEYQVTTKLPKNLVDRHLLGEVKELVLDDKTGGALPHLELHIQ